MFSLAWTFLHCLDFGETFSPLLMTTVGLLWGMEETRNSRQCFREWAESSAVVALHLCGSLSWENHLH